ncbi:MAG: phosphopentomutase [Breznakia sp.]
MSKRFIVVVLDSFGVGEMDDVKQIRPQDIGSNTCLHILESNTEKHWTVLEKLGLFNALGKDFAPYKKNPNATFGISKLKHYGGDTFFGHQEIMGTNPKKPYFTKFSEDIDDIESGLLEEGLQVKRFTKEGSELLCVNQVMFVGDNMETDLGQAINVTGSLDLTSFDEIKKVGHIARRYAKVSRVIAFGGENVTFKNLEDNIITKHGYIGIDAPASGVYRTNYHVLHIGYGVNANVQIPHVFHNHKIPVFLYGKVADIVDNPDGKRYSCVSTEEGFEELLKDMNKHIDGFYCLNIQETDLAGHAQDVERYTDRLNVSDKYLVKVIDEMDEEDILVVMADHGNDPTIGHSKHTRENVPLLIYGKRIKSSNIGVRETMADVGATAADYFGLKLGYGKTFLNDILE